MLVLTAFLPVNPNSLVARRGSKVGKSARSFSANEGSKKLSMTTCLKGSAWRNASQKVAAFRTTASETSRIEAIPAGDMELLHRLIEWHGGPDNRTAGACEANHMT